MIAKLLIAQLALAQLPLSTQVELPSGKLINLAADYADTLAGGDILAARGNVELSSGEMVVRADELTYDTTTQRVTARGNVRFFAFPYVGVADQVTVDITGREAQLQGGLLIKKRGVSLEQLLAAKSVDELKALGDSQLSVTGTRIRQKAEDVFEVDDLSFTPCDCDPSQVTWRVEARRANVQVGERAILQFPVVYVKQVPVFALPWLYLPVTDRRSGLLVPRPVNTPQSGFGVEQPLFITLGESHDLTFTPGYYFGNEAMVDGIRGPRLLTEFRYVPSTQTNGRATLGVIYDLKTRRDPLGLGKAKPPGGEQLRGFRAEGSLAHDQDLGHGWRDRVDASFVSDGFYTRDLNADIFARENQYLRSNAVLYKRADDYWAGVDVALRQDLRWGYSLFDTDYSAAGIPLLGPATLQRLPAVTFAVPERLIAGPLRAGFQASFVRIAPVLGKSGDEGVDGQFNRWVQGQPVYSYDCDGSQGNGEYEGPTETGLGSCGTEPGGGEREARMRVDLQPRVSASLLSTRFLTLTPYAALRQDVYLGEATGALSQRGYPLAGAVAETELSRVFQWKEFKFRHAVTPLAEVRYVPLVWGAVPHTAYDEVDAAVPGRLLHGVVELRNQLQRRHGAEVLEVSRFDLGQGFDLSEQRAADSFGRLTFQSGPVKLASLARYDVRRRRIAQISASGSIDDLRGDAIYASYDRLRLFGTDRTRRGIDALVGPPAEGGLSFAEQVTAGIRLNLSFGLGARYEAVIAPQQSRNEQDPLVLRQQTIGLSYGPACDCWRLDGQVVLRPGQPLQAGVFFSISRFGSFGAGG